MSPEQIIEILIDVKKVATPILKRYGQTLSKTTADEFGRSKLKKEAFQMMKKGFVAKEVDRIESNYDTPIQPRKAPEVEHKNPRQSVSHLTKTTKPTRTVQTLFQPIVKGNFEKKEGTKKEVYDGVAKYHKSSGVKKFKQDITLRNNKAVLKS